MGNLNLFDPVLDARDFVYRVSPIIDLRMRGLCAKPYHGHKKGCPKFNQGHAECPPDAPHFWDFFDKYGPIYAVINEFDIGAHMARMEERNPDWSERQLRCCLYWQPKARKQLQEKIDIALGEDLFTGMAFTTCPEAMGMNVTATLSGVGIALEWPPTKVARQVAIIGNPKR